MARRCRDPATTIQVILQADGALRVPWYHATLVADSIEAIALAEDLGDPVLMFFAETVGHIDSIQAGDWGHASRCLVTMGALSERLRHPVLVWQATLHRAAHALLTGDHEDAERLATEALKIGSDSGQPDVLPIYGAQLIVIRLQQGRLGELVPVIAQMAADNPGVHAFQAATSLANLEGGNDHEAGAVLDAVAAEGFESIHPDVTWLDSLTSYAEIAAELHAEQAAEELLRLLAPYHAQVPFEGLIPLEPVSWYLGRLATTLGSYDDAEAYFEEAGQSALGADRRFSLARTALGLGRVLAARGGTTDRARARTLLESACDSAASCGFEMVLHRAQSALLNLG
jgi:hypothetical protein